MVRRYRGLKSEGGHRGRMVRRGGNRRGGNRDRRQLLERGTEIGDSYWRGRKQREETVIGEGGNRDRRQLLEREETEIGDSYGRRK